MIYMDLFLKFAWHAECILSTHAPLLTDSQAKVSEMNMTLSLLNAAALVALVAFHFQANDSKTESVAVQAEPHYLMKQSPRFAAMSSQRSDALLANDTDEAIAVDRSQRWVF